jgi:dTDP-4-dehydrorhamnose reductase
MKLLLLGKTGQLGWELQRTLQPLGELVALDYPEINMADAASIRTTVQEHRPQLIVNATAYTAVDKAESEPELAEAINGTGPGVLAEEARKLNAELVHFSTDYVFDGKKGVPYIETDRPNPLNVYGSSKLHGEQAVQQAGGDYLILRTSWVYSLRQQGGFVGKVLQSSRQQESLRIVVDQISNPTWARMLAEITSQVLAHGEKYIYERAGLYHLAGDGLASRFEWARLILQLDPNSHEQLTKEVLPVMTSEFPSPALRPLFSGLDCSLFEQTFNLKLPSWQDALRLAVS